MKKITEEIVITCLSEYKLGYSPKYIHIKYGIPIPTIYGWISASGIKKHGNRYNWKKIKEVLNRFPSDTLELKVPMTPPTEKWLADQEEKFLTEASE